MSIEKISKAIAMIPIVGLLAVVYLGVLIGSVFLAPGGNHYVLLHAQRI